MLSDRYMQYHINNVDPSKGPTHERAKKFGQMLIDNCKSRKHSLATADDKSV